jgi:hypothetical protein
VARSDWSTCRDLIGPRVLAVATSRFRPFGVQKNRKKLQKMDAAMARFEGKMGHPFKRHH